ncbi:MAG: sigma 54-interacting transcriptional regulator, partial [Kiritimatiellia bacterium]
MHNPVPEIVRHDEGTVAGRPPWLQVTDCLLAQNVSEALRIARLEAAKVSPSLTGSGFDAYNLVRAELASGAWEGATRLIKMRQARGNVQYWDEFFLARAELLAGSRKSAIEHFVALLEAVTRYQAQGRLDFEIRLACDIAPEPLARLRREAEQVALKTPPVPRRTPRAAAPALEVEERFGIERLQGISPQIAEVRNQILRFADLDAPVLITGETGTGKELVARALHEVSFRRNRLFIAVNCASITESLLESELFGHEKGAFTGAEKATKGLFEEAGDGTIFLDEIGDITPRLQTSLLRVLETGEIRAVGSTKTRKISCRILAATNADLVRLAEEGKLRKDLLYRLQRLEIHLPPLRERRVDILILARYFLDAGRPDGIHATVSEELSEAIRSYDWPGNVRELKNVIERMRLMHSDKPMYALGDLDLKFQSVHPNARKLLSSPTVSGAVSNSLRPTTPALGRASSSPSTSAVATSVPPLPAESAMDPVAQLLEKSNSYIRRMERLRNLFDRFGKLTRSEVVRVLGISPNTATKYLQALCDQGYIRRVAPSASTRSHYFVRVGTVPPPPASSAPEKD